MYATVIFPILFSKSSRLLARQKIAIISEATVISKPSSLGKPLATPPRLILIDLKALRSININLGGVANGFPREDGFDITVASEIMAIFCLANNLEDLEKRIGNITVAYTREKKPIYAKDLNAHGPMTLSLIHI